MAIKIIDADQPLQVESIIMVIFGIPGIGKTSLAFTANEPFLLDFDGGLQRSVKRKKAARVEKWEDAVEFYMSGQLEQLGIKTLVIDTVGTMLDNYIADSVIRNDAKNAKKDGSLGLSGYGAMKNVFNQFVNTMRMKKIDLIFIAHDADVDEGGQNKKKPKVTGGSYDILKGAADLVGYLNMENNKRMLEFNPTDTHEGKNSAEFDKFFVPHYTDAGYDGFTGNLIQKCKDKMNALSEEMVEAQNTVEEYKGFIENCNNLDELFMLDDNIKEGLSTTYQVQVQKVFDDMFTTIFNSMTEEIADAKGMEEIIKTAAEQPKKYANVMKAKINEQLKGLGLIWDKEAKKVVVDPEQAESSSEAMENESEPPQQKASTPKKPVSQKKVEEAAKKI